MKTFSCQLPEIKAGRNQVFLFFSNRVQNPVKFGKNGVTANIRISSAVIKALESALPPESESKYLRICYEDHGKGIHEKHFQKF